MTPEKTQSIEDNLVLSVDTKAEFVFNTEAVTQEHLNIKRMMNKELEDYMQSINSMVQTMIIQFMHTRRKAFNEGITYVKTTIANEE